MPALLDTGFLLAVLDADDSLHHSCARALQAEASPLLPDVVLPELAYMVVRELGHATLSSFLRAVASDELILVRTEADDLVRAAELIEQYADNRVDFVDCVIVALAERLNIERVLTVDQRHFGAFRPKHCASFQIVP